MKIPSFKYAQVLESHMGHWWSSGGGASFPAHGRSELQGLEGGVPGLVMLPRGERGRYFECYLSIPKIASVVIVLLLVGRPTLGPR